MMKFYKIFYISYFFIFSIYADTIPEKIAIFPYKVNFQIHNDFPFPETNLPNLLQDATIFLSRLHFQYEFVDSSTLNQNFLQYKEGLSEIQAKIQLSQICSKLLFAYFLVGEADFISMDIIKIKQYVFSCKTNQKLYSSSITTKWESFQKNLTLNTKKILPFLTENFYYKRWNSKFTGNTKIFILIDTSGSMEQIFSILKENLDTDIMNIYAISPNQNIKLIKNFKEIYSSGSLTINDLIISLNQIKKELIPFASELWIFFDSFSSAKPKELNELGILLKELTNEGILIKIFQTYKTSFDKWKELENYKTFSNLDIIPVKYGRTCGFSDGFHALFVRYGNSIFLCNEDQQNEYMRGFMDIKECPQLETYHFTNQELDLDLICSAYAKKEKLKLVYASSVLTDLSLAIRKTIKKESQNTINYKLLLKDNTRAFWIYISDTKLLNDLLEIKNKNENFYIGLSFYKNTDGIVNVRDKILFWNQKDIPQLFVINYTDLEKRKNLYSEDIYFFWVKIIDIRYE